MLISVASFAALVVALVGLLILWSNPARRVNRTVCSCSLNIALWLACLHIAGHVPRVLQPLGGLFWLRMACAIGAWVPLQFWIVKETIVGDLEHFGWKLLRRGLGWIIISIGLAGICFTDFFIPHTAERHVSHWGYYAYIFTDLSLYSYLFIDMFRTTQALTGARKLELQVWLGGGCVMTLAIFVTMALNALTKEPIYIRLQPLFVLGFYGSTAFAITSYRIFDAGQILRVGLNKLTLVISVTAIGYGVFAMVKYFLPEPVAFLPTIVAVLAFASALSNWLDRKFHFFPQAVAVRQAAFAVARRESRAEKLEAAFIALLKGWGQTDHAIVLSSARGPLRGSGLELGSECTAVQVLRQIHWVTPERLLRERETPDRVQLGRFLAEHRLGVAVVGESTTVTVLIGVGVAASRRPFTYPQVTQLMELTSIFEGAFERAQLSVKMQHAEQLATVGLLGASLAHEIRNPLVSIKTFVQLLPTRHQDPAFRDKFFKLMSDEVTRIDRLTEQLLELASPRAYLAQAIELHAVLRGTIDLVAAKAADKRIRLIPEFQASPDRIFSDAAAVKQVLLNLCLNAIQAMEGREVDGWIRVTTANRGDKIEMAVADNGPGIAGDISARLFEPFQSTKSTGFGLGLAICRDILTGLNAAISVDPPIPGQGATFRVTFPCQPSSS